MGAGRKTETYYGKEKSGGGGGDLYTPNCSVTARNLGKAQLVGVIFGCKNHTIQECFSKNLFGLPAPHYSYVRNITPKMTLFLFNYSDRRLHGIFEATSWGGYDIDPNAWSGADNVLSDSPTATPYSAQVKFRIRVRCNPLTEEQYGPILADNYYASKLFWFELDSDQTNKLVALFSPAPPPFVPRNLVAPVVHKEQLVASPNTQQEVRPQKSWSALFETATTTTAATCCDEKRGMMAMMIPEGTAMATAAADTKPWTALFKTTSASDHARDGGEPKGGEVSHWSTGLLASGSDHAADDDEPTAGVEVSHWSTGLLASGSDHAADDDEPTAGGEVSHWSSGLFEATGDDDMSCFVREEENAKVIHGITKKDSDDFEVHSMATTTLIYEASTAQFERQTSPTFEEDNHWDHLVQHLPGVGSPTPADSLDVYSIVTKLSAQVEDLRLSHSLQNQRINYLEQKLDESRIEIQQLRDSYKELESRSLSAVEHLGEDGLARESSKLNEQHSLDCHDLILVGGFDGFSWSSTLDSYCLSEDVLKSHSSMCSSRTYASATKLNENIYIFGGIMDALWSDSVESYNPVSSRWTTCPSLNRKKGVLACVCMNDDVYALGGGNRTECFSDVEMLDPDAGRWIFSRPMLHKRFSLAAAGINGMLYAVGGYDGKNYLESVEGYDPRENSWKQLKSMSTRRAAHSLVVMNEKLYALGGFDGYKMVATVEVFDPRVGSWMEEASMITSRGYFGAAVMGDAIYALGGVNDDRQPLETVECYKEGYGWQVTGLKAIGKRCCFSAVAL
ncbi:hypothetical protein Tsubulata_048752 [Turnera subulata]|uniref:DCD domain-containing protein n=1 Tax=Turnera subulata TaxID=218843 RepID=A0A9Q0FG61_9ROSI|nr:hypothetical protein Tsubulata_048752 [Turnera subulata]